MATQICNVLAIDLPNFSNATAAAARTYTATRQLRMFDLKVFQRVDPGVGANTVTVSNAATVCITKVTPNPPDEGDLMRLGQNALDTVDDAQMVVARGGTIVFAIDDANAVDATLYCWTL
ncbi:hypothetical protein CMI37_18885 [Candidatus Pacearchaeota archaeon]|nr:hypothetical protein [Candidatus Pacearchaeota archaeon]|tara:strand:+ start:992 stop:1351 length:360 start_codon:yes stop_codon:yes gene_type:complete